MSFIGSAIKGLGQTFGLLPEDPTTTPLTADTTAPTASNSASALDAAAQRQAAAMTGGRTSTMLTGGTGVTDDAKYTSKILLGR